MHLTREETQIGPPKRRHVFGRPCIYSTVGLFTYLQ